MKLIAYNASYKNVWNECVKTSKNGTFLLDRNFMDYHSNRFTDCSVMFCEDKAYDESSDQLVVPSLLAVFPANWNAGTSTVHSHQGLTYGGLILNKEARATEVMEMMQMAVEYWKQSLGASTLVYVPIPHIYATYPSEEDLYALFRMGAHLRTRSISSALYTADSLPERPTRKWGTNKAHRLGLVIEQTTDVEPFWQILDEVLMYRHQTHPVHSVAELQLLMSRFPDEIRLYVVKTAEGKLVAGSLFFLMGRVAHSQYIASSMEGREMRALDLLFHYLIREELANYPVFDFGISNENGGLILNEGLISQKQDYGGRGIVYDSYILDI